MIKKLTNNISILELESKIKILKGNEIYRYGDVLNYVTKICDEIKNKECFSNTILNKWLSLGKINSKKDRIIKLFDVMCEYAKLHNIPKENENVVIIHIRAGDDYMNRGLGSKKIVQKIYSDLENEKKKKKIEKIIIVTALHYGVAKDSKLYKQKNHRYHYSDLNKQNNFLKLKEFIESIDIPVEIYSSTNIDNDFCYLCLAQRIITSGGGFSKLVSDLNSLKNKHINQSSVS